MPPPRYLVLATGNPGKVKEFEALLGPAGFTLLTPGEVGFSGDVEESGASFRENALIKAQVLADHLARKGMGHPVLADDSGLEVDALGGAPGMYSARYAAPEERTAADGTRLPQDAANRAKLMRALAGRRDRAARFRCVLCLLAPGRAAVFFEGVCEGEIAPEGRGEQGFGYDPLFIPRGFSETFGELPGPAKDPISHRGLAAASFLLSLNG